MTQPLSIGDVRAVIRSHPVVFAGMANAGAVTAEDITGQLVDMVERNPAVLDDVVARGMGIDPAAAAKLGFMRYVYALAVATKTVAALDSAALFAAVAEELGNLRGPGGMVLQ